MSEISEVNKEAVNKITDPKKDEFGAYLTTYELLRDMFAHLGERSVCKDARFEDGSVKDNATMRHEIGWKCSKCGETWRIALRRLRDTKRDPRLRQFGGYSYMRSMEDFSKVLKKY